MVPVICVEKKHTSTMVSIRVFNTCMGDGSASSGFEASLPGNGINTKRVFTSVPLPSRRASKVLPTSGEMQLPKRCKKSQHGGVSCAMLQLYMKNGWSPFFHGWSQIRSSSTSWPLSLRHLSSHQSWICLPCFFGAPQSRPGKYPEIKVAICSVPIC